MEVTCSGGNVVGEYATLHSLAGLPNGPRRSRFLQI